LRKAPAPCGVRRRARGESAPPFAMLILSHQNGGWLLPSRIALPGAGAGRPGRVNEASAATTVNLIVHQNAWPKACVGVWRPATFT
jgi:hypothetical protein